MERVDSNEGKVVDLEVTVSGGEREDEVEVVAEVCTEGRGGRVGDKVEGSWEGGEDQEFDSRDDWRE